MNRLGRFAVYLGVLLVAAGVIIGFGAMYVDSDGEAVVWLGVIPVGFLIMLVGTVMSQLHGRQD